MKRVFDANPIPRLRRICIVGPFPPRKGGLTVQTVLLDRYLKKEGIEVERIDTTLASLNFPILRYMRALLQPLYIFFKLISVLPKCDAAQLQACSYWGFIPALVGVPVAKMLRKRSIVFYMGGLGPKFFEHYRWLVKKTLNAATISAACSDVLVKEFEKRGVKTELLNNIFETDLFIFRERKTIEPKLIWTRAFQKIYNPMMAVKAFELIKPSCPAATLVMTSDGEMKRDVEEYIKRNSIEGITLTGNLPVEQLAQKVNEADIWINTSSHDGLPTSILEAAAAGLVIVTTPVGGIPDVFTDNRNAVMVDVDDYKTMADAVLRILHEPQKMVQMGIDASRTVMRFTWRHEWPKLKRFYGYDDMVQDFVGSGAE